VRPLDAPSGKIFILKASTLAYLTHFKFHLSSSDSFRDIRGPKFALGAYAPLTPPSGEIFVREASTSQYLIVFLISAFYL